jgi:tetratricopeptide (TPR) repeat protein
MIERLNLILTFFLLFFTGLRPCIGQQQNVDSLSSALQTTKADTCRVNLLYKLSDALKNTKPDQAIKYANQGLSLSHKIAFKNGQSICLNALGLAYYQLAKLDTALICFEKRVEIASEMNDSLGIAQAYDNLGVIYHQFGKNVKALELRMKSNRIYVSLNEKKMLAAGYTWIGNIYKDEGKYTLALENYIKALKIYEEEKNENDLGYPLINISSVYRFMKQYSLARSYALEAKSKFIKANNQKGVGVSLYRLALINNEEKDFDSSVKYLKEAKLIFEEIQDIYFQSLVNILLGTTHRSLGQNEIALKYFNDALPIVLQIGDKALISNVFQNIGTVFNDKGDFLKALEYMHKSEKILGEINDKNAMRELDCNFIELYSRINQPDLVMKYLNNYRQLSDTIFNKQNNQAIAEMQTKYEAEKKDKEIIALNLEKDRKSFLIYSLVFGLIASTIILLLSFINYRNKKRKERAVLDQRAAELSRQVCEYDMKALRSQMNPHFIFNCVDSIERLLDNAKIEESKWSLSNFSSLTRTVLENSMKREIPLDEEVDVLKIYMDLENVRFRNPFTYNILIQSGVDAKTTLIPPLILQPFVENSIKHGFRDTEKSGHLKIEIWKENEFLICVVEDNGVGRKKHLTIKPLSGFKKESMGIKLTGERLRLISEMKNMKSHFLIDDLEDTLNNPIGTRVKMFLPYELSV